MQNFMKTILNGVQKWTKTEIKKSTADWNQNDPNAVDYVKNKTHYAKEVDVTVLPTMEMDFTQVSGNVVYEGDNGYITTPFVSGKHYTVIVNGISYDCVGREDEYGNVYLGNYDHRNNFNSTIPFCIYSNTDADGDWCTRYELEEGKVHTIAITTNDEIVHKLDSKYLPDNLAITDDVQGALDLANTAITNVLNLANTAQKTAETAQSAAETAQSTAETAQSAAETKMNKVDPSGSGTFSVGRVDGSIVGRNSTAIGNGVVAEYNCSFVEGKYNEYSTDDEYIEVRKGNINTNAHGTNLKGRYAYGSSYTFNKLTGIFTIDVIDRVNWERIPRGYYFCSTGDSKHSYIYYYDESGQRVDIGSQFCQYENITKISSLHISHRYKYAHIVGNGTSDTERSNAHTLDWNGVGWYQGGLQVGGNAQDDGAKNVLLEGDVPDWSMQSTKPTYTASEVGLGNVDNIRQYSASNPPVVVQSSEPEDTSVIWVDIDDNTMDESPNQNNFVSYEKQTLTERQKAQARENIGVTGSDGKSAYDYAKDGGYTGTEAEFAAKLAKEYPTKVSELDNDSKFITISSIPVTSVNGKTGAVTLDATAVGARPSTWTPTASDVGAVPINKSITVTGIDADGVSHSWTMYGVAQ